MARALVVRADPVDLPACAPGRSPVQARGWHWHRQLHLWCENLCHQAIFVDDATRAVVAPDPEMIQVGDAIWQGPQWRGLAQGAVRTVRIAEILVLSQHHHQVVLIPDQGPVQQLTPAAANPPLHDRIHSGYLNAGADDPDPSRLEHGIERLREAGIPVRQDELHLRPGIFQVHEQVPGLLDDPGLDRVLRGAQDPDAPGAVLDHQRTYAFVSLSRSAVKKSSARIPCACDRRNAAHPGPSRRGAGTIPASLRICHTVDGATLMPSAASSPWTRR